jgi:hypothetical protein
LWTLALDEAQRRGVKASAVHLRLGALSGVVTAAKDNHEQVFDDQLRPLQSRVLARDFPREHQRIL